MAVCFFSVLFLPDVSADILSGKVVSVHDGDTITVLDANHVQHKIRLAGIDAPELRQAFGRRSRDLLSGQVAGKVVQVEWYKRDKYRRIIGKILLDGKDINLSLVTSGLAWHYRKYAGEQVPQDRTSYAEAENTARQLHLGLWQDPQPTPPWDYRRTKSLR